MNSDRPPIFDGRLGLGYKPDLRDERDLVSHDVGGRIGLFGAAPSKVIPASMMRFRKGHLYQGRAGSCVAHAIARTLDMCFRAEFESKGIVGVEPPKASRRLMYFNGRQQEVVDAVRVGMPVPPMADRGCYPRLAMRGVQKIGFCDEQFFSYTDDPVGINEIPPTIAYKNAFDQSGFRYSRPVVNVVASVADALALGKGSIFGMFVDTAFMNNKGELISRINTDDPEGGGHMLSVLEVTDEEVIFDNWWSPEQDPNAWGTDGIGRMTHKLFESHIVSDRYIIEAAPFFTSEA